MAEKTRISRRDLKGPDEFISTFGRTVAWCKENRSKFAAGAIAVVAVVALALGIQAYLQWKENKSSLALWPTLDRAQQLLQVSYAADPSQLAAIEQFLQGHVGTYPNTRATVYSLYYLGNIAFSSRQLRSLDHAVPGGIATGKEAGIMRYLLREGIRKFPSRRRGLPRRGRAYRDAATVSEANLKANQEWRGARPWSCRKKDRGGGAVPPDPPGDPGNPPSEPGRNPAGADGVTSPGGSRG